MNLPTPEILTSLDGYQLLSDPADPYEPDYTGEYLIVERLGLHGLVRQQPDGAYDVAVPVQYPAIQYRLLHDTFRDKRYDLFWLYDQQGKVHLWMPGVANLGDGYRFDAVIPNDRMLYPVLVVRDGLVGYLDLWEVIWFPYAAEACYYPGDPSAINWEEMDWIYGDIKVPNHEGKWALFGYDWEPLVDFVLDREPHSTRHGQYSFGGPDRMSKRRFFEQYGVRG